ncbi:MAG: rRNA maturation RNase YbeY [Campylobacteraceae bacterium 4484_4]|nr:MAG: rRNA maturation RNase YbeY [Campylobacteraceae bacterium 4484_4]
MIYFDNRTDFEYDIAALEPIVSDLSDRDVEVIFTSDEEIADINEAFRGISKPTDVLSFPLEQMPHSPLGTVIISIDHARAKAEELGHRTEEEIALLFIHGMLHLLGYDHEQDQGQMRARETELIVHYNLPESLIQRSV